MVSVTNAEPERIYELLDEFAQDVRTVLPPVLSIRNGRRSVVITGTPEQLSRFELYCEQIAESGCRAQEQGARRCRIQSGLRTGSRSRSVSTPASGRRRRHRRPLGQKRSGST